MGTASRHCTQCRTPVPPGAAFCSQCGAATPTEAAGEPGGELGAKLSQALAGRYTIERELGQGGMAVVYLAHDVRHERDVALKVLRPDLAQSLGAERFLREIKLAARLNHPNILPLYDSGQAGDVLFYAMPVVEGESLRDKLTRERQLPLDEALKIAGQIAAGLSYAHERGVIHRDVKPENILLSRGHVLIADFGIGKAVGQAAAGALTATGASLGTPLYMSPEQAAGDPNVDHRSDVYSLGCVLYEMLAGEPPFTAATVQAIIAKHAIDPRPSIKAVRAEVPDAIDAAIQRALASSAADRFATVDELAASIAAPDAEAQPRTEDHAFRLRPSFTGGLFGGVAGGLAWGAVSGFGYIDALSNLDSSEKAWLLGKIVLTGAFAGAVLGTGIQVASQWAVHRRARPGRARLGSSVRECAGSVGGGLLSGMIAGLVFALLFASLPLAVPDAIQVVSGGVLVSVLLVLGVLSFDYHARWSDLLPPMLGAIVVTVLIVTIGAVVLPFRWMLETFLAGEDRVKHALGGLLFGGALGSVLGFQVGMSLVLDAAWRGIRPASTGPPLRRTAPVWQRGLALVATGLAGAAVLLLVYRNAAERGASRPVDRLDYSRILVFPFASDDSAAGVGRGELVARELSAQLADAGRWSTVDPQEVLARLNADTSARARGVEWASTMAVDLDAGRFVIGRITASAGRLRIDAELHPSRGGRVWRVSWEGAATNLDGAPTELARRLLIRLTWHRLGIGSEDVLTESLAALRAHLNGELALDEGRLDDALRRFEEAVQLDAGFALGWLRLARVAGFARRDTVSRLATARGDSLLSLMSPWERERVSTLAKIEIQWDVLSLLALARTALDEGRAEQAQQWGSQALDDASRDTEWWDYGTFVHDANAVLGRVALRQGDTATARRRLLAAGATPGSSRLRARGPRLNLAKELLDAGQRDVVLQYLELCTAFWNDERLGEYTATVRNGGIPRDWLRLQ